MGNWGKLDVISSTQLFSKENLNARRPTDTQKKEWVAGKKSIVG